ncbi:hypothetical protein GCM10025751_46890 [Haladaptatus pallidirubidus]|uniref:Uncharacterized protein n=2 Tax=Haladaptatus pallidirubidus TaxID=1008152 RepID=A0AAV3UP47_9EURY
MAIEGWAMEDHTNHDDTDSPRGYGSGGHATLGGLSVHADGFRFVPVTTRFSPGEPSDWKFHIVAPDGTIRTEFDEAHGQRGHLIVVRRDLTRFQHLHPTLENDGTWRVEAFTLPDPGIYRAFLDLMIDGRPITLGFDIFAPGPLEVAARPETARHATTAEYHVELSSDEVSAGETTELTFEIRRNGDHVSRLDSYLGALGHLVALREGDLAYLHVHPEETSPDSGRVKFGAKFPTPGRYRLFLQSKPEGTLIITQHDVRIDN